MIICAYVLVLCNFSKSVALGYCLDQGPLLVDGLLGAEMPSLLKIKNYLKSSFGVNVRLKFFENPSNKDTSVIE
jgi:hypothetical protein